MQNFELYFKTKIYFGNNQIDKLMSILSDLNAKNVLVIYGVKSAKLFGGYEKLFSKIDSYKVNVYEYPDIEKNTEVEMVRKAINYAKAVSPDCIISLGGGSVIDCAKWISIGGLASKDIWHFVLNPTDISRAIPIIAVPTIASSGSETDAYAVIYNKELNEKIGIDNELLRPYATIIEPFFTFSLNRYQAACGISDIVSHIFENYLSNETGVFLQDSLAESLLKTCFKCGDEWLTNIRNYEACANIMLASNWAINGLICSGKKIPWTLHPIEHAIGLYYDIQHSEGMAVLLPRWIEFLSEKGVTDKISRIKEVCFSEKNLSNKPLYKIIDEFYMAWELPTHLSDLNIDSSKFNRVVQKVKNSFNETYIAMNEDDIMEFLLMAL